MLASFHHGRMDGNPRNTLAGPGTDWARCYVPVTNCMLAHSCTPGQAQPAHAHEGPYGPLLQCTAFQSLRFFAAPGAPDWVKYMTSCMGAQSPHIDESVAPVDVGTLLPTPLHPTVTEETSRGDGAREEEDGHVRACGSESAALVQCDAPLQAVLEEKLVMNWWVHAHGNIQPLSAANIDGDGNCLPASLLCGLTGCARDQTLSLALRKALHREMIGPRGGIYRERWMTAMALRDGAVGLKLNESQWNTEWDALVAAAATAGTSLSEVHVLILAHVLRRPIIVFSSKVCPACGW